MAFSTSKLSSGIAKLMPGSFLTGDPEVVAFRVVSEQRKHETILPRADPWQDPVLQPAFMKTGMTPRLKLIGLSAEAPWTSIGMILVLPSKVTLSSVLPSLSGWRIISFHSTIPGWLRAKEDSCDVPRDVVIVFGLDHDGVEIFFGLQANGWRISFELYVFCCRPSFSKPRNVPIGHAVDSRSANLPVLDPTGENVLLGFGKGPSLGGMISSSAAGRLTCSRRRLLAKSLATSEGPESPPFFAK